ncbi:MAG TPA: hypothetical protein VNM47_08040 [Terriglobia bacterium]|nr:hypothetical protein [Terriglobia bacterium]
MRFKAISLAAPFLIILIPTVCCAQDFSADVVYFAASKNSSQSSKEVVVPQHSSRLFVSDDKIRLETRGLIDTILLVDGEEHTSIALFPRQKEYQYLAGGPSEYFRVTDAENACPDWQKATTQRIACEKIGDEVVNGRQVVKYRNNHASDATTSEVWIDAALKFVVKWQSTDIGAELLNIREEQQAAALFDIPPTYKTLKPMKGKRTGFAQHAR